MANPLRTRCHIHVRNASVEALVVADDGTPKAQVKVHVEKPFDAAGAVHGLKNLPHGQADEVTAHGRALYDRLFADPAVRAAFLQCETVDENAEVHVCIELHDDLAPDLRTLRWETLCDEASPNPRRLAADKRFRLARRLRSAPVKTLQPLSDRPRVLVVISNPANLNSYQTAEGLRFNYIEIPAIRTETKALDTLMASLQTQGRIQSYQILGGGAGPSHLEGAPSLSRIRTALDDAVKEGKPHHILHILSHGYVNAEGVGHLILTDNNGYAVSEAQDRFLNLLPANHQLRLVVFAACQSDQQAVQHPLAGLAPSMLQKGMEIPAVVAMQDEISVGAAAEFTRAFYEDLGHHGYLDTAMSNARTQMATQYPNEWAIPVLYLQTDNPCLFNPDVSLSARNLTTDLFSTAPVEHFVNRETELADWLSALCEADKPGFYWLWGPKTVGKWTLLQQLCFEAYRRGYGHLVFSDVNPAPLAGNSEAAIVYDLLQALVKDNQVLQKSAGLRTCLATFLAGTAANVKGTITDFLDGIEEWDKSLERGLLCMFYFYDFSAHQHMLSGAPFTELVWNVGLRHLHGQLKRVRFLVATEGPQTMELYPGLQGKVFFQEETLSGLTGPKTIWSLCQSYGLIQGDLVPAKVNELVKQSRLPDQRYLPQGPVRWLKLQRNLLDKGKLRLEDIQDWAPPDGGGGL